MWSENNTENIPDATDAVKKRLRPRSPFMYNKIADRYQFDSDREFLEAQYRKSPVSYNSQHYLANFIRPVSLATLKSLSHTKQNTCELNILGRRDNKMIQPIFLSHKNDSVDRFNIRSAPSDVGSIVLKSSLGNGGQRSVDNEDCKNCSSGVSNDKHTLINNEQFMNFKSLHSELQLSNDLQPCSRKMPYNTKSSESVSINPCTVSPLSYNLRKPHVAPNLKFIPYPIPSTTVKRITHDDKNSELSINHSAELTSTEKNTYSERDQTRQFISNIQRCQSIYKTGYTSPNPGFPEHVKILQPHSNSITTYKDIKQAFENFNKATKQFKIYEASSQSVEDVASYDNRKDSSMLKIAGNGNIEYAISICQPRPHSAVLLKNHGPHKEDYGSGKIPSSVYEQNEFKSNSDNIPNELRSSHKPQSKAVVMETYERPSCLRDSLSHSKDTFQVYPTAKQVEIDSGNGTDEDDHIFKETNSLKDDSVTQKVNENITYSCNTNPAELYECFSSDIDEDGTIVDDDSVSNDNQYIKYQLNEEPLTNSSSSELADDNSSGNEDSLNPTNINEQSDTFPTDGQHVVSKKNPDLNGKQEITEVTIKKDLNAELCMQSKLSNFKLSTFSTKTEKHSTLHVVAYDHNTTKKDIISTGKCSIPKNFMNKHNENLSISHSTRTIEHRNISVEKESSEMSGSTELKNSDDNLSLKLVNASAESPPNTLSSKEIKTKPKKGLPNRFTQFTRKSHPALIDSLFPNVPPVLRFVEEGQKLEPLPWEFRRLLKWRASSLTPIVVKQTLQRTGFKASKLTNVSEDLETVESSDWIFYFGKHMRPQIFRTIKMYQKVNHLPCSFQLGRKDRLWRNIVQMQLKHGKEHFNFMPQTYCLPGDLDELKKVWDEEGENQRWIMKPPASARGIGVRLVTKWSQIPKKRPALIQKYSNAICSLGNRYIHLTNYSINRLNSEYISNTNEFATKGHKWSLRAFWTYLKTKGISPAPIWSNIKDVVVKTIISTEAAFNSAVNIYCNHSFSVHEIFGFDIFLDEDLQPWLLEVNVSPSMHSDSPLDAKIKGNVIKDMLNLSGLRLPEAVEPCCHTIPSSFSLKFERNTPDLIMCSNMNTHNVGHNVSNMEIENPILKNDDIFCRHIKSASFVDNLKTKNTKSDHQRPNPPNHRWLLDERLFIESASTDEEEKMKYFKMRAIQYGLPRVKQFTLKYNSSTLPYQYERNDYKTLVSCKSSISNYSDTNNSLHSCITSSNTDEKEIILSPRTSINDTNNNRRLSLSFSSSSSLSSVESRKSAQFMRLESDLPDFKINHLHEMIGPKIKLHSASNGNLNSEVSVSGTSNLSKNSHKSPIDYKNLNSSNLFITSHTSSHVMLKNATSEILDCLTPFDVRILISMVDEFDRAGGFHCVFPPKTSGLSIKYLSFFESPRYTNLLCIAYLQKYSQDKEKGIEMLRKICEKKIHLKSSLFRDEIASEHHWKTYKKCKSTILKETIKRKTEITPSTENLSQNTKI
uniref:Tubulin tyrosine ligase-related n=1 Tax=Schistosoma mansoni TaxID=6183 RepID=A0A3Q0KRK4_SCHMA